MINSMLIIKKGLLLSVSCGLWFCGHKMTSITQGFTPKFKGRKRKMTEQQWYNCHFIWKAVFFQKLLSRIFPSLSIHSYRTSNAAKKAEKCSHWQRRTKFYDQLKLTSNHEMTPCNYSRKSRFYHQERGMEWFFGCLRRNQIFMLHLKKKKKERQRVRNRKKKLTTFLKLAVREKSLVLDQRNDYQVANKDCGIYKSHLLFLMIQNSLIYYHILIL